MATWHGWGLGDEAMQIGPLPGRKSIALSLRKGAKTTAKAYFTSREGAEETVELLDRIFDNIEDVLLERPWYEDDGVLALFHGLVHALELSDYTLAEEYEAVIASTIADEEDGSVFVIGRTATRRPTVLRFAKRENGFQGPEYLGYYHQGRLYLKEEHLVRT